MHRYAAMMVVVDTLSGRHDSLINAYLVQAYIYSIYDRCERPHACTNDSFYNSKLLRYTHQPKLYGSVKPITRVALLCIQNMLPNMSRMPQSFSITLRLLPPTRRA